MSSNQDVAYQDIAAVLQHVSSPSDAADSHGFMCGLICATGFADPGLWVNEAFDDYDPANAGHAEAFAQLQSLSQQALTRINSTELDFELLLPDDSVTLRERTESLGSWCAGFLSGLGMAGVKAEGALSEAGREMLEDLAQIARVDFDLDDSNEEEEAAFQEVVEYIRVGVLFLHEELQPAGAPEQLQ